jgi:hypothetical protein
MGLSTTFDTVMRGTVGLTEVFLAPLNRIHRLPGYLATIADQPTIASHIIVWMTERRTRLPACQFPPLHPQSLLEGTNFVID